MIADAAGNGVTNWIPQDVTVPNASEPWHTAAVANPPSFPVTIVFLPEGSSAGSALEHLMKGTSVVEGAPQGLMGAVTGFTPSVDDTVVRVLQSGNVTLIVKAIDILAPDGYPILYTITFN
jgi:hypothetical protein